MVFVAEVGYIGAQGQNLQLVTRIYFGVEMLMCTASVV
jgi:hypothetical protein